jgi:hypothetical protein
MGPNTGLAVMEGGKFLLPAVIELQSLGNPAHSLVAIPTELLGFLIK